MENAISIKNLVLIIDTMMFLASIGLSQLKRLKNLRKSRKSLKNLIPNLKIFIKSSFKNRKVSKHSWYHYTVRFLSSGIRDMVRESLETNGIETRIAFPPIHLQPMFNRNFDSLELPNTCLAFETMLDIPCHAKLKSDDINLIIKIVKESILQ